MRTGWVGNTELESRLHRVDPAARVMVEAVEAEAEAILDLFDEWSSPDSGAGVTFPISGGARLSGSAETHASNSTGGAWITDLDLASPVEVLEVEWGHGHEETEIHSVVARLVSQKDGGSPKEVEYWRAQLFRLVEVSGEGGEEEEPFTLAPISQPVQVEATGTTTASNVTFAFTGDRPPVVGPPPTGQANATRPRTYLFVWALKGGGEAAGNVGWECHASETIISSNSNTFRSLALEYLSSQGSNQTGSRQYSLYSTGSGVPRFELKGKTYSEVTISYTSGSNQLDLGAAPTSTLEVVAQGETPGGTSLTYELNDGSGWVEVFDGDRIGEDNTARGGADLSGMTKQQTYTARVTLTPNEMGYLSPFVRRFGVQDLTVTDLDGIATVSSEPTWRIDPQTMRGEITECTVSIIRNGRRDYRDFGTELLASNHLGQISFRIMIGHPGLARSRWLHIDDFLVDDYVTKAASIDFLCISPLSELRTTLPVYDTVNDKREALVYENQTLKDVYEDILTGQVALPGRRIGPGVEDDTTTVSKVISGRSDAKVELDALAYLAGGGLLTSQGRVKFVDMYSLSAPVAFFPSSEISWGRVSPGFASRTAEFFVPHTWNEESGEFEGEVRSFHANALSKLGIARLESPEVLSDEIAKWIDSQDLAETVGARVTTYQGTGLILWDFVSIYPQPYLEPGDIVSVQTDRFVARDPNTDREIRGEVWATGVITGVGGVWGRNLQVWVQAFDLITTENPGTRPPPGRGRAPTVWAEPIQNASDLEAYLTVMDADLCVSALAVAVKSDAGEYSSWDTEDLSVDPLDPPNLVNDPWGSWSGETGQDQALTRLKTVSMVGKHTVGVKFRVTYTDRTGTTRQLVREVAGDADHIAEITGVALEYNTSNNPVLSVIGDEDVEDIYATVGINSTPADPTNLAYTTAALGVRNATMTAASKTANMGDQVIVKVRGYNSDGIAGPVMSKTFRRGDTAYQPFHLEVDATQTATTGKLDLTISDPSLTVSSIAFQKKTDSGDFGGTWLTSWDRSSGTAGTHSALTRGEDVSLVSKHNAQIKFRVTYKDGDGSTQYYEDAHTFDLPDVAEVTGIEISFSDDGDIIVSATGDEDTANLYVRAAAGSTPSDPTNVSNDGSISGRSGSVDTGVSCGFGVEAIVKVRGYNASPSAGPVQIAKLRRGLGKVSKTVIIPFSAMEGATDATDKSVALGYLSANSLQDSLLSFVGAVVLPQGVTITKFRVRASRQDANNSNFSTYLRYIDSSDSINTVATLTTTGTSGAWVASGTLSKTVAAEEGFYVLTQFTWSSSASGGSPRWYKAEIEYEVPDVHLSL